MPSIIQPTKTPRISNVGIMTDVSSSNIKDGKIQSINYAMPEVGAELLAFAKKNPQMLMQIQIYRFGGTASRVFNDWVSPEDYAWSDLPATGNTPFGAACNLIAEDLEAIDNERLSFAPAIVLVSDGQPNDSWEAPLARLHNCPWGRKANRIAVAIGDDCDRTMLEKFLAGSELGILEAKDASEVAQAIVTATIRASEASTSPGRGDDPLGRNVTTQRPLDFGGGATSIAPSILDNPDIENAQWKP